VPQLAGVTEGQADDAPLQMPAGVPCPSVQDGGLHVRPVLNTSAGQLGLVPLQVSWSSHTPIAERHGSPTLPAVKTHPVAGTHLSTVQILPSSQVTAGPPVQLPPAHVSGVVQALPSSQPSVLFTCWQPRVVSQESFVHGLLSLQESAVPVQTPAAQ
jgi:hypothetical protein